MTDYSHNMHQNLGQENENGNGNKNKLFIKYFRGTIDNKVSL